MLLSNLLITLFGAILLFCSNIIAEVAKAKKITAVKKSRAIVLMVVTISLSVFSINTLIGG